MRNGEWGIGNDERRMEKGEWGMKKLKLGITFKKTIFLWKFFVYYTTSIFS